ncbi:unnamed protein product [Rhizophagus irregularis]|nr:unnamed protein product [Rhizophagus irregularis]
MTKPSSRICLDDGTIKAYEIQPATATTMGELYAWDHQNLKYGTHTTLILGAKFSLKPDSWVRPIEQNLPLPGAAADNFGNPYLSMVIEGTSFLIMNDQQGQNQEEGIHFPNMNIISVYNSNTEVLITAKYLQTS